MPVAKSKGLDFPGLYFASTDTIVQSTGLRPSDEGCASRPPNRTRL